MYSPTFSIISYHPTGISSAICFRVSSGHNFSFILSVMSSRLRSKLCLSHAKALRNYSSLSVYELYHVSTTGTLSSLSIISHSPCLLLKFKLNQTITTRVVATLVPYKNSQTFRECCLQCWFYVFIPDTNHVHVFE